MKKAHTLLSVYGILFIGACTNKEINNKLEKFPVTNPLVIDTAYANDYIADIQSLRNVELRARVNGYLEAIHVDEGESVKEGQLLFSISSQEFSEELLKAKAQLKSAIAEAKSAELDLLNVTTLVEKNIVSKTEAEMAQSKLDALNAKIDEARSYEASAQYRLSLTEIKAPFDGIIDRIPNKCGSLIDEGTLMTTISDNKKVYAYFNLSENEYLYYFSIKDSDKPNDITLILANNQTHNQNGCIETVDGQINKNTGSVGFRSCFPNPDLFLKNGSSGKVRIKAKVKNALLIPQKSTFEVQEKTCVYIVDKENNVQIKSFVPQFRLPHLYIVESGLTSNDRIIYEGLQRVKEGDKIIPELVQSKDW